MSWVAMNRAVLVARAINVSDRADERRALARDLQGAGRLLGLLQVPPDVWFRLGPGGGGDEAEIVRLIEQRSEARRRRDFAEADRIRDQLSALGVLIEDGPDGTRWRRAG